MDSDSGEGEEKEIERELARESEREGKEKGEREKTVDCIGHFKGLRVYISVCVFKNK